MQRICRAIERRPENHAGVLAFRDYLRLAFLMQYAAAVKPLGTVEGLGLAPGDPYQKIE